MVSVRGHARHWRTYLACGGLGLALSAVPVAPLYAEQESQKTNNQQGQPTAQPPAPPIGVTAPHAPPAYNFPYGCERPKDAEQDNLCIERRGAEATERQADWARRTFWLGVGGTIFVVLTLIATGLAAYAAWRATKIAEKALTDLERPHVFVTVEPELTPHSGTMDDTASLGFQIANYGRFPADIIACFVAAGEFDEKPPLGNLREDFQTVLGPDKITPTLRLWLIPTCSIVFERSAAEGVQSVTLEKPEGKDAFFRIDIIYRGLGDARYESRFVWRWDYYNESWVTEDSHRT